MSDSTERCESPLRWPQPGELWSLWDMLNLIPAEAFNAVAHVSSLIQFLKSQEEKMRDAIRQGQTPLWNYDRDMLFALRRTNETLEEFAQTANFSALREATRSLSAFRKSTRRDWTALTVNDVHSLIGHLEPVLSSAILAARGQKFYALSVRGAEILETDTPLFGVDVDRLIPDARDDIAEAGNCLAFGRHTGAAHHTMRAMEAGVMALAKKLNVSRLDYKGDAQTWGKMLDRIEKRIKNYRNQQRKDRLQRVVTLLSAFNRAYRIETAHGNNDLRPRALFTEDRAIECWNASRSAMQYIAEVIQSK